MACMSALCSLVLVIVGILMIIRVITLEQFMSAVGRAFSLVIGLLLTLCLLKNLLATVVIPGLLLVEAVFIWASVIALAILVVVFVTDIVITRFMK